MIAGLHREPATDALAEKPCGHGDGRIHAIDRTGARGCRRRGCSFRRQARQPAPTRRSVSRSGGRSTARRPAGLHPASTSAPRSSRSASNSWLSPASACVARPARYVGSNAAGTGRHGTARRPRPGGELQPRARSFRATFGATSRGPDRRGGGCSGRQSGAAAVLRLCRRAVGGRDALRSGCARDGLSEPARSRLAGVWTTRPPPKPARRGRVRAARLAEALRRIRSDFADPEISPETIAARLGISTRYLHALLHESGASFAERVQELRLAKAQRCCAASAGARPGSARLHTPSASMTSRTSTAASAANTG